MDDNKLLHKNPEMISDNINEVKKDIGYLSVVKGNKNTFLVMNEQIKDSTIQVDMVEQLEKSIEMFGEEVSTVVTSPAGKKFFEVWEDAKQLSENKGELLHSVVVRFLFIIKRSRPDLETSMDLLMTRVSKSDFDD